MAIAAVGAQPLVQGRARSRKAAAGAAHAARSGCGVEEERKNSAAFSPSAKREYVDWITEAKTDATRQRRHATAIEWMAEGKRRSWKYMNC